MRFGGIRTQVLIFWGWAFHIPNSPLKTFMIIYYIYLFVYQCLIACGSQGRKRRKCVCCPPHSLQTLTEVIRHSNKWLHPMSIWQTQVETFWKTKHLIVVSIYDQTFSTGPLWDYTHSSMDVYVDVGVCVHVCCAFEHQRSTSDVFFYWYFLRQRL